MGQWLSEQLGQQFVIENRTGASTNLGTEAVVRAPPDGYTLLMIDVSAAVNATLYDKLSFNFIRDITPVANVVRVPNVIAVHPSFPAKTVPEFIAHAKGKPGKVTMATAGNGSTSHIFGELFKMMAGVNLVAVPYRGGGPALIDMLSGQVDVIFVPTAASIEYVRAGRLRPLAITSATRLEALRRRLRARLRGKLVGRRRRTEGHAGRDRRQAQHGDQRGPCRSQDEGPSR
jgi:tripartite-type tricarboxylate transporter receptor subunit TctC